MRRKKTMKTNFLLQHFFFSIKKVSSKLMQCLYVSQVWDASEEEVDVNEVDGTDDK